MDHRKIAGDLFLQGYNCAQAVFAAFCEETGMEKSTALRLASSFGAGIGKTRGVCGAVSGMCMVAGLLFGFDAANAKEEKACHYARIQGMLAAFEKAHGSTICRELLKGIKTDVSPFPAARDAAYYKTRPCLKLVETAAGILDEMQKKSRKEEK